MANRGELISLTQAAQNNAQAFRDNGGSAEETLTKLVAVKEEIVKNAIAHGENADEVRAYVDEIYKIPTSIPLTKVEVDTADAMAKLVAFAGMMKRWQGKSVDLNSTDSGKLGSGLMVNPDSVDGHADGGTVTGAGSGTSDSVMQRLSVGEEVIKTASASQARPFLKAFNNNPTAAMAAAGASRQAATAVQAAGPNFSLQVDIHPRADQDEESIGRVVVKVVEEQLRRHR